MAHRNRFLVPFVALLLGAHATAFSLIAYSKRIKAKDVISRPDGLCVYPSSPSSALGIVSALFLLAEQIVISAATYCFCCCGLRCSARCAVITSLLFFIGSWLTFLITFTGLTYTVILNNSNFLAKRYNGKNVDVCTVGNENLFLGAAYWCIISTAVGLISDAFWACGAARTNNNTQGRAVDQERGVAMGEPQMQQPKE